MTHKLTAWGSALAACLPLQATAQAAATPAPKPPPPLAYHSAFADYRPYQEVPPGNWRALNAALAERGQASAGAPPAPAGADARVKPAAAASASHAHPAMHHPAMHHKMHGGRP